MERIYERIIFWIIMVIIVLIPLVSWQGVFFSHTFIKVIVFRTLVELAFVFWIPLILYIPAYRLPKNNVIWAVGLLLATIIFSSFNGIDLYKSFWSDYERMMGVITYAHGVIFFIMLVSIGKNNAIWHNWMRGSVLTALVVSIFGIVESTDTDGRIVSTIGNAAFLSSYLLVHLFLAFYFLLQKEQFSYKTGGWMITVLTIGMALILTEARAGLVGVVAGVGCMLVFFLWKGDRSKNTIGISYGVLRIVGISFGTIFVAMLTIILLFPHLSQFIPEQFNRFADFSFSGRTAEGRFLTWNVAKEGWKDKLLLGWGPENFNILFNTHYVPELYPQEPWFDRAHNILYDIGTSMGVVGLMSYAYIFITAFFLLWSKWREKQLSFWGTCSLGGFLIAYLTHNLFTFDSISVVVIFFLVLGFIASRSGNAMSQNRTLSIKNKTMWTGVMGGILLVIPTWHIINGAPLLENIYGHKGWETLRLGGGDANAIALFEKSLSYNTHGDIDMRRFFTEYVFEFLKQGGNRPDESLFRLMTQANAYMDANILAEPQNVKWYMYQGELYNLMAVRFDPMYAEEAKDFYLKARTLSPNRPQIYLGLAEAYKRSGDIEAMWKELDAISARVPEYPAAHEAAAVAAIEINDREREANEIAWLIGRGHGITAVRNAYIRVNRYEDAIRIQKQIIYGSENLSVKDGGPTSKELATFYAQLAAFYHLAGNIDQARITALIVLKLDPTRKSEVDAFLNSL